MNNIINIGKSSTELSLNIGDIVAPDMRHCIAQLDNPRGNLLDAYIQSVGELATRQILMVEIKDTHFEYLDGQVKLVLNAHSSFNHPDYPRLECSLTNTAITNIAAASRSYTGGALSVHFVRECLLDAGLIADEAGLNALNEKWHQRDYVESNEKYALKRPRRLSARVMLNQDGSHRLAFLGSDKYRPIENKFILDAVLPELAKQQRVGFKISSFKNSDDITTLNFKSESLTDTPVEGSLVAFGVNIKNSCTGKSGVLISPLVITCYCDNGQTMATSGNVRKNHVQRAVTDLGVISAETIESDNKTVGLALRDATANVVNEDNFRAEIELFKEVGKELYTAEFQSTDRYAEVCSRVQKELKLPDVDGQRMRDELIKAKANQDGIAGKPLSNYDIMQAITALQHSATADDHQIYMQAGQKFVANKTLRERLVA
jgi:hypothetical protein